MLLFTILVALIVVISVRALSVLFGVLVAPRVMAALGRDELPSMISAPLRVVVNYVIPFVIVALIVGGGPDAPNLSLILAAYFGAWVLAWLILTVIVAIAG